MNKLVSSTLALSLACLSFTTFAAEKGETLAAQHGCLSCHAVDHKIVGPAYKDVAKKYQGVAGIEDKLFHKVRNGGGGVWGAMAMPAQKTVSDADLHTILKWVLSR
ncbi:c-type cytochrome [Ferrovum sp. PN-J185]|uniref:c-type cytochrome n=1 Tax=Ferrovum sp. PN-J185 TaxID=1356306 RepID=UPI000791A946|nr:c-type cytochrome [Ferrovum sp. PN-J185]KXW55522.1 cytochrome c-551 precursor [Ferrovum sp. PN-J185]MCC6067921.1 c-type cytochrome [Ferrovum sp. PN-J185]MDE1891264.1 c-type cytochrome [Betaproteobacteria bacterium]MDE2056304.1 c-type cytochrome [Betaproteobacteria bacterium]